MVKGDVNVAEVSTSELTGPVGNGVVDDGLVLVITVVVSIRATVTSSVEVVVASLVEDVVASTLLGPFAPSLGSSWSGVESCDCDVRYS